VENDGVVYDDWFLPSLYELVQISRLPEKTRRKMSDQDKLLCWSSSECTESTDMMFCFDIVSGKAKGITASRSRSLYVLAARRF